MKIQIDKNNRDSRFEVYVVIDEELEREVGFVERALPTSPSESSRPRPWTAFRYVSEGILDRVCRNLGRFESRELAAETIAAWSPWS
jgi:hypothetical protein